MSELFSNKASTTLNGAIDNSQTTLTVTSATGFPSSGNFRVIILAESGNTDEILTVTGVSGTTFTVTRASEATAGIQSASAHSSGATISHVLTAGSIGAVVPTHTNYIDYITTNGSTTTVADASIAQVGAALMTFTDGNNGGAFIQWYRAGTFNNVIGLALGESATWQFRGTTFSAGASGMSFFLESNSAGARLMFKNNLGFNRTVRIWEWGTTSNIIT